MEEEYKEIGDDDKYFVDDPKHNGDLINKFAKMNINNNTSTTNTNFVHPLIFSNESGFTDKVESMLKTFHTNNNKPITDSFVNVLMIAEKPSIARLIGDVISNGNARIKKNARGKILINFNGIFKGIKARYTISAVAGHIYTSDFLKEHNKWNAIDHSELYNVPTIKLEATRQAQMPIGIRKLAKGKDIICLWLDCDKEGENICYEVLYNALLVMNKKNYQQIYRAKFSSLTKPDLQNAFNNLNTIPNKNESLSVDCRQIIDLKIGVSFTRFLTSAILPGLDIQSSSSNNNNNNKSIHYNNTNNTKHKHNKSYQYKNIHHLHSYYHQQTKSITSFSSMLSFNNPNIYMNNILLNNDNNVSQNDNQDEEDNAVYDVTFLNNLIQHNNKYKITKELILSNKQSITPTIRAKAYNTLMQLCEEFAFKRETYFLAVFNCDRCLSKTLNDISLRDFHLIALTSLALSAKIEEVQIPKLIEYTSTFPEYSFTLSDIILMEQTIMTQLNWNSIPNTMNTWLSWHICQWDLFIDSVDGIKELLYQNKDNNNTNTIDETVYFKKKDDVSYYNYRRITQLIDLFSLDIESLNYNVQYLVVCAILFVLIETKHCDNNCNDSSENDNVYMKVFQRFVCESFGEDVYGSDEFRNVMEYCLNMKGVEFVFDLPLIYQVEECEIEKGSYEEFITYQTTNEHLLEYLLKTKRLD